MSRMTLWKRFSLIVMICACGLVPEKVFSDATKGLTPFQPMPSYTAGSATPGRSFALPADGAEKQLAGDAKALAAMKYAKARKMYREYLQKGDMKKLYTALDTMGEAVTLDSGQSRYWVGLGNIHSELTRFNLLRSHEYEQDSYRQALDLAPDDALTMVLLGVALIKAGEYDEGLGYLEKAVRKDILMLSPDIARWMNVSYLVDGRTRRGIIFYDALQKSHPDYRYLNLYKAVLYRAHFDNDGARRELTKLLKDADASRSLKNMARELLREVNSGKAGAKGEGAL